MTESFDLQHKLVGLTATNLAANRVVIVDEHGRVYDRGGVSVEIHTQDDGLTLKVFVKPLPPEARKAARARHGANIGRERPGSKTEGTEHQ